MMIMILDFPAVSVVPRSVVAFVHVDATTAVASLEDDLLVPAVMISVRDAMVPSSRRISCEDPASKH